MVSNNSKVKFFFAFALIGLGLGLALYALDSRTIEASRPAVQPQPLTAPANIKDPNFRQTYYAKGIARAINTCRLSCDGQCTKNGRGDDAKSLCYQACDTYYKNWDVASSKEAVRIINTACAPLQ